MKISVTVKKHTPGVEAVIAGLDGPGRTELHEAMVTEVQHLTEAHLRGLSQTRHATALKLGAEPSNFWSLAADKVASPSARSANQQKGTLTINQVGMIRALRDVTILPRNAQSLAIPVNALAYNRRPAQIWTQFRLFILRQTPARGVGNGIIAMPGPGKTAIAMYILVRSVTQKQDRTLLPTDQEFHDAGARGARRYVGRTLKKGGKLS